MKITLPRWYDLHAHFRQGDNVSHYIDAHIQMGCAGILAMPNTLPPVSKVTGDNDDQGWSIEGYKNILDDAGADQFENVIVPLYLTQSTTTEMIQDGATNGDLVSCKYYPPHGTTNSGSAAPIDHYIENGVFAAMEKVGVILNIHGEMHDLPSCEYFDEQSNAEDVFYTNIMPQIRDNFPNLKIVCEHITTETAVNFIEESSDNIAATITPQHLLYTVGDLLKGFKYHLYCLPLVKFEKDRKALLSAALQPEQTKFFAGTDSAPHHTKVTECGCAAGCFTGFIAPQLYAQALDLNENNQAEFKAFLCTNGPQFYDLPIPTQTFSLEKKQSTIEVLKTTEDDIVPLNIGMGEDMLEWTIHLD